MTSIEWLWEQIDGIIPYQDIKTSQLFNGVLEQAKEMHKAEIIKAFDEGQEYEYQYHINNAPKFDSETYYQETFGSKGSDAKSDFEKPFIDFAKQYVEHLKVK